jgi:predicted neuraminidase
MLMPLYSDGYNVSLVAISDDNGDSWRPSLPIVGRGNIQPALLQKRDGTIVAYMRDNGDAPQRIVFSSSTDQGETWSVSQKTDIPNPGSSVDAIVLHDGHWLMVYNDLESGRHRLSVSFLMMKAPPGSGSVTLNTFLKAETASHIPQPFKPKMVWCTLPTLLIWLKENP